MFDLKKFGIIWLLVIMVVVLFVLSRLFPHSTIYDLAKINFHPASPSPKVNVFSENISVIVNNSSSQYAHVVSATSPYLALVEAAKAENQAVEIVRSNSGIMVDKVGGVASSATAQWTFKVNGKTVNESADLVELKPGDTVEWTLVRN
jgi:hypothetical protein